MTEKPITIVSGLPRSGTSMMMQILEAGGIPPLTDNVRKADDDNPRGYYELEAVKKTKEGAAWLEGAPGKAVKMVHLLLYDLPPHLKYRVIYIERDIREVIASQNRMLDRMGKERGGLSDAQTARVFQEQVDALKRWLAAAKNFKVLFVSYNDLIAGGRGTLAAINAFLGGGLDVEAMARIVDPTLYRQRKA
jgi:hypothetical protein